MEHIYKPLKTLMTVLLLAFAPILLYGQSKITGTVNDESNQPVPGVSIMLKGSTKGTTTDANGRFTMMANPGQVLEIRSIGFNTQQVTLGGKASLLITMISNSSELTEVVVTALGIKKETKRIGYAVSTVNGAELTTARDPNPITGLIGKVAGLSVGPSAELLGNPNVSIRGNTLSLYVVDGFPINTDTYNLSPDVIIAIHTTWCTTFTIYEGIEFIFTWSK